MKMFEKSIALTLAVLMLLTSMTVVSFAAETYTGDVKWLWLQPNEGNDKPAKAIVETDDYNYYMWKNGSFNSGLTIRTGQYGTDPETMTDDQDNFVRMPLNSSYTKKTGVSYEPLLDDTTNPYYEVWIERTGNSNSEQPDLDIEILGDDGTCKVTVPGLNTGSGWIRDMYKIGTVKLSQPQFNYINVFLPLNRTYYDTTADGHKMNYLGFGSIKLVQVKGVPTGDLLPFERSEFVMEPVEDLTIHWNGFSLNGSSTNAYYGSSAEMMDNLDDIYDVGLTHNRTERSYGANYSTVASNRRAQVYRGLWEKSASQAGWYKIYIDKMAHQNTTPVPYLTVQVIHANGTSEFIMDRNHPETKTTWNASRHYIGTFKMNNGTSHQVRIYGPILADGDATSMRIDMGALLFVPVTEEEALAAKTAELTAESDLYMKPVYTADFVGEFTEVKDSGSEIEYYPTKRYNQLKLDATNGETSIQTVPYEQASADLKKALEFDEGILDFDLYWTYTQGVKDLTAEKAPYVSVILGKSATAAAEIRIYADKAQLIEGSTVTDLYIPTDYYYYVVTAAQKSRTLFSTGWKSNFRIEITDVNNAKLKNGLEATSRSKSKDGEAGATKLLKIFLNGSDVCIGAAYIPKGSVLYSDSDYTDNYIKFVNNPGIDTTEQTNLIKVRGLSVSEPDASITSGALVEETIKAFGAENGTASYKMNSYIPVKRISKLGENEINKQYSYVIGAYKGDTFVGADAYEKEIKSGDKADIDLSVDVSNADTVKFFSWNNFDDMTPYETFKEVPIE